MLAVYATASTAAAFHPSSHVSRHSKTRLFADDKQSGGNTTPASAAAETAASGASLGTVVTSIAAPLAALAAGRQALTSRDQLRDEVAVSEKDLSRIKKDLKRTDTLASVSYGQA